MSIASAIEKRIREAIERGEFDDLPGKGKPIDLEAYFNTPEDLRMAFAMLKSNDYVPAEIELIKEVQELRERLKCTETADAREAITDTINEKSLALRLLLERNRHRK